MNMSAKGNDFHTLGTKYKSVHVRARICILVPSVYASVLGSNFSCARLFFVLSARYDLMKGVQSRCVFVLTYGKTDYRYHIHLVKIVREDLIHFHSARFRDKLH